MRRLFTLLRYAPREGAFFASVVVEEEEPAPKAKPRLSVRETARLFGLPMPAAS